jgi:hypothetical protein
MSKTVSTAMSASQPQLPPGGAGAGGVGGVSKEEVPSRFERNGINPPASAGHLAKDLRQRVPGWHDNIDLQFCS